jgi:Beta-lactamase enzyme family
MKRPFIVLSVLVLLLQACSPSKHISSPPANDPQLEDLLKTDPFLRDSILPFAASLKYQVIYTSIDRHPNGTPSFTDHFYDLQPGEYYYPASTVKLPIAALALQKLHELNIPGVDMYTTMITGAEGDTQTKVYNDPSTTDGRPCIAGYIKKILLVSDNDAFNRLYEFLGQEYINQTLHHMGYTDVQIVHRLELTLSEAQNRATNPIRFIDTSGRTLYEQPARKSHLVYAKRNTLLGKGYMKNDRLISEPFNFSKKNRLPLQYLHSILRSILFPETTINKKRFALDERDYLLLHRYMSMYPRESSFPELDSTTYNDTYVKFLLYGSARVDPLPGVRIFNKVGDAYGFLIDAAYVADFTHKIEFQVSAMIYCNSDSIFNDNKYDYDAIGQPFFRHLGQVIYNYELKRKRTVEPDLSKLRFDYRKE